MKMTKMIPVALLLSGFLSPHAIAQQCAARGTVLDFTLDGPSLRVGGGEPGKVVGIVVGLERAHYLLPGNAELQIAPLFTLAIGRFDEAGEWRYPIMDRVDTGPGDTVQVLFQALSYDEETLWCASQVLEIEFTVDDPPLTMNGGGRRANEWSSGGRTVARRERLA